MAPKQVLGHNKNLEVYQRTLAQSDFGNRQPACTNAENQLVPVCDVSAKEAFGEWKSAHILRDHIAIEAGFSKSAFQAQCVILDDTRFVHVKKNSAWFIAAVGGPQCKKGGLPAVQVIDELCSKIFGKHYKDAGAGDGDRNRGEDGENDEEVEQNDEVAEFDPMSQLEVECAPDFALETPKKKV